MTAPKFPIRVKNGSVTVTIYHTPSRGTDTYTVCHYQNGKRIRTVFAKLEEARTEAETISIRLGNVEADVLTLRSQDRAAYLRSRALLDPLGIPIETAAAWAAEMVPKLHGIPPMRCVDYYLQKHALNVRPRTTLEVVEELMELKTKDGLSPEYLRHLGMALRLFAGHFKGEIQSVEGVAIDDWLRSQQWGPRTRNNVRTSLLTLFNFAVSRRYLPKDFDELNAVALAKDREGEIEIYSPAEMAEILEAAPEGLVPFLTIGAFAGIRPAEIQRLTWRNIQLDHNLIEIRAANAKTASRRTVPILPNLKLWLEPCKQEDGLVCKYGNVSNALQDLVAGINRIRKDARPKPARNSRKKDGEAQAAADDGKSEDWKFQWKRNGLRHSFISYRVAEVQNVAQVALEAGNSPQMIFKHYRELVRPETAKAWFGIVPGKK